MMRRLGRAFDNERVLAYTILAPTLLLVVLFGHVPALSSLRLAFLRYNIKQPGNRGFVGFQNFITNLTDPNFHDALLRVSYFLVVAIILVMMIGLICALALNQKFWGRSIFRAIIIIPWAIPPVVSGHMWRWILNGEYGALNGLLFQLGLIETYQFWLAHPFTALTASVVVFVWRLVPFITVLLLGALQSIPHEHYESASIDGAGKIRQFWYITLPSISTIGAIGLALTAIFAFNVFDEIYALTGIQEVTRTPMIYTYETAFVRGRFGQGAAMAYLTGIILFLLSMVYMKISLREQEV